MKCFSFIIALLFFNLNLNAQVEKPGKTKFIAGLSGPELLHAGLTYRLANASLLGLNAGIGPSWGMIWSSVNFEHRLYVGNNSVKTNQRTWFF